MEKEERLLMATIEDKKLQCERQYMITHTSFLDVHQRSLAEGMLKYDRCIFYGGYEDAERAIVIFLPDYATEESIKDDNPLAILRVTAPKGSRKLTHRDYLGSILGLGIDRSVTGDIIVKEDGADIIILKDMGEFLLANYEKAGRTSLKAELIDIDQLDTGLVNIQEKRDTVASLRLDSVVSSAFGLARGKAQEAVKGGIVFVNNVQCMKPDLTMNEGDKIVLRGRGKVVLREVNGRSRKDRICIVLDKYQ